MGMAIQLVKNPLKRWKAKQDMTYNEDRNGTQELARYIKEKASIRGIMENLGDIACEGSFRVCIYKNRSYSINGQLDVYGERMQSILKNLLQAIEDAARNIAGLPSITCDLNAEIKQLLVSKTSC